MFGGIQIQLQSVRAIDNPSQSESGLGSRSYLAFDSDGYIAEDFRQQENLAWIMLFCGALCAFFYTQLLF